MRDVRFLFFFFLNSRHNLNSEFIFIKLGQETSDDFFETENPIKRVAFESDETVDEHFESCDSDIHIPIY